MGEGGPLPTLPAGFGFARPQAAAPHAPEGGLCVTGSRSHPAGRSSGWLVLIAVTGEDGTFTQVCLTTDDAREQARQLIEMADVLEGKVWR